jgi:hypothetical protein
VLNSKDILYSKGNNDECYTPEYAVLPILEFTEQFKNKIILCPFDTEESNFVKILKNNGFHVVYSHIRDNQNFYNYQPEQWDVIISNPPFSNKKEIFERALSFDKPFALLMTLTWLNDSGPKKIFYEKDLQLLMFDKRVAYINAGQQPTFSSAYYCYNFLPKQIIMRNLIKTKTYNKEPQLLL